MRIYPEYLQNFSNFSHGHWFWCDFDLMKWVKFVLTIIFLTMLWRNSHNHGMIYEAWNPDYVFKSKDVKSISLVYCCLLLIKNYQIHPYLPGKFHCHCVCQEINPAEYRYMYSDHVSICNVTTANKWNRAHISWDTLLNESTWFLSLKSPRQWWYPAHLERHQDNDNGLLVTQRQAIIWTNVDSLSIGLLEKVRWKFLA